MYKVKVGDVISILVVYHILHDINFRPLFSTECRDSIWEHLQRLAHFFLFVCVVGTSLVPIIIDPDSECLGYPNEGVGYTPSLDILLKKGKAVFSELFILKLCNHTVGMPLLTRCHWQCLDRLSQIFATLCKVCFYGWFSIENEVNAGNFCPGLNHWALLSVQFGCFSKKIEYFGK